ncbi:MAG: hypothetical protein WAZ63_16125 [Rhodoferax sp.]|uniref:hypothetical protein n=1 Tax=Rhodoferax sp. TaxID=50421 RepID=UPI003BB53D2B
MKVPLVEKRKNLLPYLAPLALAALLGACGKAPQTAAATAGSNPARGMTLKTTSPRTGCTVSTMP